MTLDKMEERESGRGRGGEKEKEQEEVEGRVAGSWKAPHVEPPSDKALGYLCGHSAITGTTMAM
jgi:hypothetical protein